MSFALIRGYDNRHTLSELWGQAFGDDSDFISDMYGCGYLTSSDIFALTEDGRLVAALFLPEYRIRIDGTDLPIRLLSCVATEPTLQGKGYMSRLISRTLELIRPECCGVCVIPVSEDLYSFYGKFGFTTAFYVSETIYKPEVLNLPKVFLPEPGTVADHYSEYRKKYIADGCVYKTEDRFRQAILEYSHPTQPCSFFPVGTGFAFLQHNVSEIVVREWAGVEEDTLTSLLFERYSLPVRFQNLPGRGVPKPIGMFCSFSEGLSGFAASEGLYLNCMYN